MAKTPDVKKASPKMPDKLTGASMIGYLSEKNGLARKQAKQVMEDVFECVATGVMRGERVAMGKMGKMFVRVRPAGPPGWKESAKRPGDQDPRQACDKGAAVHLQ